MKLIVSSSPHLHSQQSLEKIMWAVVFSLFPAGIMGVFFFGLGALKLIVLGVVSALITEFFCEKFIRKRFTLKDASAIITGLLLAYNLPPHSPWWLAPAGSIFAIAIGKEVFGGLGQNIFNPALVGRVFLLASWPKHMTTFSAPLKGNWWSIFSLDAVTGATPLSLLKEAKPLADITYLKLFLGNRGGCLGETCIPALLSGALFLWFKGYISLRIPLSYISTVGLFIYLFGGGGLFSGDWLLHIFSGGLILGAFFMATDYVTSPLTPKGQIIFGVGCGIITTVIRLWGGYPEGVSFAILIMNAFVPLIDRYTKNRVFGDDLRARFKMK